MATGRYTIKMDREETRQNAESTKTQGLLFVAVLIIYSYQGTGEGEDFAKGDED